MAAEFAQWVTIAGRLSPVLEESTEQRDSRMAWLRKCAASGDDVTSVAAGAALAGALLSMAVLSAPQADIARMLIIEKHWKDRENFRHDFARCVLQRLHQAIITDTLVEPLTDVEQLDGAALLSKLLEEVGWEIAALADAIGVRRF